MMITRDHINALAWKYPGLPFTERNGKITDWQSEDIPKPRQSTIDKILEEHKAHLEAIEYKDQRKKQYLDIGDQLDAIWKFINDQRLKGVNLPQETDNHLNHVLLVKKTHPKPE